MYINDSCSQSVGTVQIQGEYTATIRLISMNTVTAFICRIGYPIMRGIVLPIKKLKETSECSHTYCLCEVGENVKMIDWELCASCFDEIRRAIQSFLEESPEKAVSIHI